MPVVVSRPLASVAARIIAVVFRGEVGTAQAEVVAANRHKGQPLEPPPSALQMIRSPTATDVACGSLSRSFQLVLAPSSPLLVMVPWLLVEITGL